MRKFCEMLAVFGIGAGGYTMVELLWRGYSHWTMALTGGVCFLCIYLTELCFAHVSMWKKCLVGSLVITQMELTVGFFVNILLMWDVWDYSDQPVHLFGQICPLYSALWFLLCIPCLYLCRLIRRLAERYILSRSADAAPSPASSAAARADG